MPVFFIDGCLHFLEFVCLCPTCESFELLFFGSEGVVVFLDLSVASCFVVGVFLDFEEFFFEAFDGVFVFFLVECSLIGSFEGFFVEVCEISDFVVFAGEFV